MPAAFAYTYTTFDIPGPTIIYPLGINDQGVVVGSYDSAAGMRSFIYAGGVVAALNPPATWAKGINNLGSVVGDFHQGSGVVDANGTFTAVVVPNASWTSANGISNAGAVVGSYYDGIGMIHDFTYTSGIFTTIDPPGATWTNASGINTAGVVVGSYDDAATTHGFVYANGIFTTIDITGIHLHVCLWHQRFRRDPRHVGKPHRWLRQRGRGLHIRERRFHLRQCARIVPHLRTGHQQRRCHHRLLR